MEPPTKRTAVSGEGEASPLGAGSPPGSAPLHTHWGARGVCTRTSGEAWCSSPQSPGAVLYKTQEVRQTRCCPQQTHLRARIKSQPSTRGGTHSEREHCTGERRGVKEQGLRQGASVPSQSLWFLPGKRSEFSTSISPTPSCCCLVASPYNNGRGSQTEAGPGRDIQADSILVPLQRLYFQLPAISVN